MAQVILKSSNLSALSFSHTVAHFCRRVTVVLMYGANMLKTRRRELAMVVVLLLLLLLLQLISANKQKIAVGKHGRPSAARRSMRLLRLVN